MGSEALGGVFGAGFGADPGCKFGGATSGASICTQRDPTILHCAEDFPGGGGGGIG